MSWLKCSQAPDLERVDAHEQVCSRHQRDPEGAEGCRRTNRLVVLTVNQRLASVHIKFGNLFVRRTAKRHQQIGGVLDVLHITYQTRSIRTWFYPEVGDDR